MLYVKQKCSFVHSILKYCGNEYHVNIILKNSKSSGIRDSIANIFIFEVRQSDKLNFQRDYYYSKIKVRDDSMASLLSHKYIPKFALICYICYI